MNKGIEVKVFSLALALSLGTFAAYSPNTSANIEGPYFNNSDYYDYTDPYRGIYRSGYDLEKAILKEINSARFSIDLAVQEIRLPHVAKALARRFDEGLRVRVILENNYNRAISDFDRGLIDNGSGSGSSSGSEDDSDRSNDRNREYFNFVDMNGDGFLSRYEIAQRDAIAIIRNAGIPIKDDTADRSAGSALMHHKFMVVDSERVLISSANFTLSDIHGDYSNRATRGNANAMMIFSDSNITRKFQTEFALMWGERGFPRFGLKKPHRGAAPVKTSSRYHGEAIVKVQFSPTSRNYGFEASSNGLIAETIRKAARSVKMSLFVFSEQKIADALWERRQARGIQVQALIEPTFAFAWYSEGLDLLGLALHGPRCAIDEDNAPWQRPIQTVGTPRFVRGDYLHHKFATVDGHTTIFGSHNWSKAANQQNDETLLIIENPRVTQLFEQEHDRIFRTARLGASASLKERIRDSNRRCR